MFHRNRRSAKSGDKFWDVKLGYSFDLR